MLSPHLFAVLRSVLQRLIPADQSPGAIEAGVENYLLRQWANDCAAEFPSVVLGLEQLDAEAAKRHRVVTFSDLSHEQQDELLRALERGETMTTWPAEVSAPALINRLVELAHEGFYADPGNGGNRDAVSWSMIRYDPRWPKNADHS